MSAFVQRSPRALWLMLGCFVLLAGIMSVVVPPFETPDEIWHAAFIQHLATGKGLPVSEPHTQALWKQQGVQAPGYYLAAAALTAWIDQGDFPEIYARANPHAAIGRADAVDNRNYLAHHADEGWPWHGSILALHVARFFSIFLGAVTLWAVYQTLARLTSPQAALLGASFIGFIPQFVFISAAASNDNAINALAALVLWLLVALVVAPSLPGWDGNGPPKRRTARRLAPFAVLGVLLGLALLAKLSALALVALAGLALLLVAWRHRSWRILLAGGLAVAVPALLIAGWWYGRNWQLYGDPLAWNVWQENILLRVSPAGWATILAELESLERSFWGLFGWMNVLYPDWVYAVFRGIEAIIAAGLLLAALRWLLRSRRVDWRWAGAGLLVVWLALLAVSWVRFMRIAPAAQGRYFFPAASTLAWLVVTGLAGFKLGRWPRLPAILGWLLVALLASLSLTAPWWMIRPVYEPRPSLPTLSPDLPPVRADLGGQFAVLGAAAEPTVVAPGDVVTVTVTWQAVAPDSTDYSVFVHLVDDDGFILAQLDTMPGGGALPTSQWTAGQTRTEAYRVAIPETAYAPSQGQWAVGLYDHQTGRRLPVDPAGSGSVQFGSVSVQPRAGQVPNPLRIDFLDNISLVGYRFSSRTLRPGEPVTVTLVWQARGPVSAEYTTFAHLLDEAGQTRGGHDAVPSRPTSTWQAGEVIADVHTFVVAPDAPPGLYQIEASLYTQPDLSRLALAQSEGAEGADRVLLGPLRVVGPEPSP